MKEFSRTLRIAEEIRRDIASMIQSELQDPRIGMVTVSRVEISRDLVHAKIFITLLDAEKSEGHDLRNSLLGLNNAAGFLRRALAKRLRLRIVPQLRFVHDESVVRGARLTALIDAAVATDRDHSKRHDKP